MKKPSVSWELPVVVCMFIAVFVAVFWVQVTLDKYEIAQAERDYAEYELAKVQTAYKELKQSRRVCYGLGKSRTPDNEVYGDWCAFSYSDVAVPLCEPNVAQYELKWPEEAWEQ